ncbi:MAG: GNAT family N-acetyltransferase, partial [Gammaproteobacteria bacterium]|nr:GNAT family N-acetyltransferase [Gammaproteobacteria bacterium]MCW5583943.1 GNAT family N-acetyltransferase [Gammaproteobacteria bacterium]
MKTNEYEIKSLNDCQDHIPALANLWYEEISRHWAPDASIEKAHHKLIAHLNTDNMPMAFVVVHEDQPIGMVCLRENDGIRDGTSPWLGSLVVDPNYRGQKVGEALINFVKKKAKELGNQTLYLLAFDPTIPQWYAKLGWVDIGCDQLFNHPVTVMSIDL